MLVPDDASGFSRGEPPPAEIHDFAQREENFHAVVFDVEVFNEVEELDLVADAWMGRLGSGAFGPHDQALGRVGYGVMVQDGSCQVVEDLCVSDITSTLSQPVRCPL